MRETSEEPLMSLVYPWTRMQRTVVVPAKLGKERHAVAVAFGQVKPNSCLVVITERGQLQFALKHEKHVEGGTIYIEANAHAAYG